MTEEQFKIYKIIKEYFTIDSLTENNRLCDESDGINNILKTCNHTRNVKNKREEKKKNKKGKCKKIKLNSKTTRLQKKKIPLN